MMILPDDSEYPDTVMRRVIDLSGNEDVVQCKGEKYRKYFKDISDEPSEICSLIQGLLIHSFWIERYGSCGMPRYAGHPTVGR